MVYNNHFVKEEDLKYVPPYLNDTPECTEEVKCATKGTWPDWVHGSLVRMGSGRFTIPLSEDGSKPNAVMQHFFDGLAILHKFRIENGTVYYTSRHTAEGVVRNAKKNGYVKATMFGVSANTPILEALKDAEDPCSTMLGAQQMMYFPQGHVSPDEVNVNVVPRRGFHLPKDENPYSTGVAAANPATEEVMVGTDFNMLQVCDAKTLKPKRMLNWGNIDPELSGYGICAHPPKDRGRGTFYNYLISPEGVLYIFGMQYTANPAKLLWKTALPCKPCYIHSLAMTDRYVVFIRNPLHMNTTDLTKQVMEMIEYEADMPTQFYVLDKFTGELVASYESAQFMFFHSINGYDYVDPVTKKVNIHVDVCSYAGDHVVYREYCLSNVLNPAGPFQDGTVVRYELPDITSGAPATTLRRATVAAAIPGVAAELPRIAKDASMKPGYRYVYFTAGNGGPSPGTAVPIGRFGNGVKVVQGAFFGSLAKSDWLTGTYKRWQPADGESCPCEPIFIARPGGTEEDDGIVVTIVINRTGTHSILVALDGRTFEEVARADMPQVYSLGPHGSFIEGDFGL